MAQPIGAAALGPARTTLALTAAKTAPGGAFSRVPLPYISSAVLHISIRGRVEMTSPRGLLLGEAGEWMNTMDVQLTFSRNGRDYHRAGNREPILTVGPPGR